MVFLGELILSSKGDEMARELKLQDSGTKLKVVSFVPLVPQVIKFSEAESVIMTIIHNANGVPINPYQIVKLSNGKLNLNSIYVQIDRLEAAEVLKSEYSPVTPHARPKLPKRFLRLNDKIKLNFA
jgi:hypothetical protein